MKTVRTRFAPSPTGYLHVGGVRTALFAWLLAKQSDGQFILRIEDTDKTREVSGSIEHIQESLGWLGLTWDEGPVKQSDRLDIYERWVNQLIEKGRAYADPYSPEEVQAFREQAKAAKRPFLFRDHRPDNPPSWDGSRPVRFKSDPKPYKWEDQVMGTLETGTEVIDDFILMKSDGYPTYNFAHIVDDAEMRVTHVLRGQEFLASVPNYLNLYEALGLQPPIFATMPHILGPDGKKKLSKRDGAKDILDYREEGYLPAAMLNFLATLGWNDGSEQEIFSVGELIEKFSLDRIQKNGAIFDERRLLWLQGAHVRALDIALLYKIVGKRPDAPNFWPPEAFDPRFDDAYRQKVLELVQERLKFFTELPELTRFFFIDLPVDPKLIDEHKQLKKIPRDELKDLLEQADGVLRESDFTVEDLTARLNGLLEATGRKPAVLFSLIRIATTQAPASPGLAGTLAILGKERSLERISAQISALG